MCDFQMFIFHAEQGRTAEINKGRMSFGTGNIFLLSTKSNIPNSPENHEVLPDGTVINILTIFDINDKPWLYIRLINCAFVVMNFMITVLETDVSKDSLIEFLSPAVYDAAPKVPLMNQTGSASKEIKLKRLGSDPKDLTAGVQLAFTPYSNWVVKTGDFTNKFIKIFDATTKTKQDYVLTFELDDASRPTKFSKLYKIDESKMNSTDMELRFSELISVFKQSLQGGTFDATSSQSQLNALRKQNAKLNSVCLEAKSYLNKLKSNLSTYK